MGAASPPPRRRRRALLGAAAAVVLLAAVVASAVVRDPAPLTREQYSEQVSAAYLDVQQAFQATRGASGAELGRRIGEAQDTLRRTAGTLDELDVPEDAEDAHADLVGGMRDYADELDELRAAVERGDTEFQARFNDRIVENPAIQRMTRAAQELEAKGYEIESLESD